MEPDIYAHEESNMVKTKCELTHRVPLREVLFSGRSASKDSYFDVLKAEGKETVRYLEIMMFVMSDI